MRDFRLDLKGRAPWNTELEPCVAHRPEDLCSSSCNEKTVKVASSKFSKLSIVRGDSVEPGKIEAAPWSVSLLQWHARALCLSRDRKCKNKSQAAKMAATKSRMHV